MVRATIAAAAICSFLILPVLVHRHDGFQPASRRVTHATAPRPCTPEALALTRVQLPEFLPLAEVAAQTAARDFAAPQEKRAQPKPIPAEEVFKNIKVLKGLPATQVLPVMVVGSRQLGVQCTYCHTQYEWDNDDKEPKQVARKMFGMVEYLNKEYFAGQERIHCWTCHRGQPKPPTPAADPKYAETAKLLIPIAPREEEKPAEEVFEYIQSLQGVPAGRFPMVMAFFSQSLGVECTHCHIPDAWDNEDREEKQTTRRMLRMVDATGKKYYGATGPITCFTCHQGSVKPAQDPET